MQRTIRSEDEKAALIVRFQQSGLRPREFCREGPKNQTPIFQGRRGRPCREAMIRASRRVLRLKPEALPVRAMATSACGPPRTTRGPLAGRADLRRGLDPQGRGQPLRRPARRRPGQRQLQVTGGKRHDYTQHQVVLVPCEGVSPDAMDCRVIARRRPRSPRRVGRYCRGRRAPFALVQPTVRRTPGMLACGFTAHRQGASRRSCGPTGCGSPTGPPWAGSRTTRWPRPRW